MPKADLRKKILECVACQKEFSVQDFMEGHYQPESRTCSFCYAQAQRQPYRISGFGKPTKIQPESRYRGYSSKAIECRVLCPDRRICRRIVDPV